MLRFALCLAALTLATLTVGCADLLDFLPPDQVTVRLVNDADFDVEVDLFISDEQDVPRAVLTELGTPLQYTIAPGETVTFSRRCDDLQALVIDRAKLVVLGQIGPEADTDVLRDGTNYHCGDTIVLTFDHGVLLADFAIAVGVQPG